jgi:hypothetical protein
VSTALLFGIGAFWITPKSTVWPLPDHGLSHVGSHDKSLLRFLLLFQSYSQWAQKTKAPDNQRLFIFLQSVAELSGGPVGTAMCFAILRPSGSYTEMKNTLHRLLHRPIDCSGQRPFLRFIRVDKEPEGAKVNRNQSTPSVLRWVIDQPTIK